MLVGCDWHQPDHARRVVSIDRSAPVALAPGPGDGRRRRHAPPGRRTRASGSAGARRSPTATASPRSRCARSSPLVTVASKQGYATRAVRLPFQTHPKSTIRIYQHRLQWSMYGVGPLRSNAQTAIKLRPPFRRRLVARARRPRRVPGGRRRRDRVHRERPRHGPCARHADRQRRVAARHAARKDGVVAGGVGKDPRRARDGRTRVDPPPQ